MLKECCVPFPCATSRAPATNEDSARNAVLTMVIHDILCITVYNLAYSVHINGINNTVVATLDMGAQCSAIRLDMAKVAETGLDADNRY